MLDFFSGSATTAQAVMELNSEDGIKRNYICIQIPSPLQKGSLPSIHGYTTICDIGRERIKRAAEKIQSNPDSLEFDYGYKVYKLEQNI